MTTIRQGIIQYLKAYNLLSFLGWTLLFFWTLSEGFQLNSITLILLNVCQFAAILEVVHALKKWVSTPAQTAFMQIISRIYVVVLINIIPSSAYLSWQGINGLKLILIAWCITEMVRYSFYFLNLMDGTRKHHGLQNNGVEKNKTSIWSNSNKPIQWMRYTFFIFLYPLGVLGEILIILSMMAWLGWELNIFVIGFGLSLLIYPIFFPGMYGHMWKQRRKKLSPT